MQKPAALEHSRQFPEQFSHFMLIWLPSCPAGHTETQEELLRNNPGWHDSQNVALFEQDRQALSQLTQILSESLPHLPSGHFAIHFPISRKVPSAQERQPLLVPSAQVLQDLSQVWHVLSSLFPYLPSGQEGEQVDLSRKFPSTHSRQNMEFIIHFKQLFSQSLQMPSGSLMYVRKGQSFTQVNELKCKPIFSIQDVQFFAEREQLLQGDSQIWQVFAFWSSQYPGGHSSKQVLE